RIIFNYQKVEKLEWQDNEKLINKVPTKPIPSNTKKISHAIIKDFIRKQIEIQALNEYTNFEQLPKKSLIGRLETTLMKKKHRTDFIEFVDKLAKLWVLSKVT
ncbi:MAG: hypothetical protein HY934_10455, partial [Candidatus Firestonebacteria bacterium]|nr:hypothetical protein [Candidatus Firestonebacteria bacterium]